MVPHFLATLTSLLPLDQCFQKSGTMVPFGTNSTIIVSVKVPGLEAKMNYKALGLTLEMSVFLRQEMALTVLLYRSCKSIDHAALF